MYSGDKMLRCALDDRNPRLSEPLSNLLLRVRDCTHCAQHLSHGPRPTLRAHTQARLLIVGQAPGSRVHATGIPWNDRSGDRLRDWLGLDRDRFYDERNIAVVPMGFCYPGSTGMAATARHAANARRCGMRRCWRRCPSWS